KAQAADTDALIAGIRKKLQSESEQLQQLQRAIHLQPALSAAQAKQAERIHKLNQEIIDELFGGSRRLLANPELARLAEHLFDIADIEMKHADETLARFRAKDRPLP